MVPYRKLLLLAGVLSYLLTIFLLLGSLAGLEQLTAQNPRAIRVKLHNHALVERPTSAARRLAQRCAANLSQIDVENVELRLRHFSKWLSVLSAYLDMRKPQEMFVRLLVAQSISGPSEAVHLFCHLRLSNGLGQSDSAWFSAPAQLYAFNENHAMPWGGWIFSCPVPSDIALRERALWCTVRLSSAAQATSGLFVDVPLQPVDAEEQASIVDFSVCVPPLFGASLQPRQLVEFVEINRRLGAQRFNFYLTDSLSGDVRRVLEHYAANGVVHRRQWKLELPQSTSIKKMWYNGQMMAVHHCLFANMGAARYTMFQDVDEILVPRTDAGLFNWTALMRLVDKSSNHCGYRFFSAFFSGESETSLFHRLERTEGIHTVRTKCMVRPHLMFEMGIHHMSKQNVEEMTPENVPSSIALLHHYRQCDTMFVSSDFCSRWTRDDNLVKIAGSSKTTVKNVLAILKL